MIEIKLIKDKDFFKGLMVSGHAYMDEYGHDIVCASVSTLTITLANFLNENLKISLENLNFFSIESEETPLISINIENKDLYSQVEVQRAFEFFEIGILSLVENYSKYVELIYREV